LTSPLEVVAMGAALLLVEGGGCGSQLVTGVRAARTEIARRSHGDRTDGGSNTWTRTWRDSHGHTADAAREQRATASGSPEFDHQSHTEGSTELARRLSGPRATLRCKLVRRLIVRGRLAPPPACLARTHGLAVGRDVVGEDGAAEGGACASAAETSAHSVARRQSAVGATRALRMM
jgi:hypothetical protein